MVRPAILPGVEQADFRAGRRIDAGGLDAFAQVAGPACQRQIRLGGRSSLAEGHDVLYFEGKVEDQFWRMAILAPMLGPLADEGISRVHVGRSVIVRRWAAVNSASTNRSSSAC